MPPENAPRLRRRVRYKFLSSIATCTALWSLGVVSAQDAAAPFRRSSPTPAPEEQTPPPEEPPAASPVRSGGETATLSPLPKTSTSGTKNKPTATAGRRENALTVEPVRAVEPRRSPPREEPVAVVETRSRVLKENPVRAAEPRKPFFQRLLAKPPKEPRVYQPTFDVSESSWATAAKIRSIEKSWQAAIRNHDLAAVDKLLANNLQATSSTGNKGSKRAVLRALRRDTNVYRSVRARGMSVRNVEPGVAVVSGIATESGTTKDGKPFKNSRQFTDTWERRKGGWHCVASKLSKVPTE